LHAWAFPVKNIFVISIIILLLALFFYFIKSQVYNQLQKAIGFSVAAMIVSFFLLSSSFYPQLLNYQAGKPMASVIKGKVKPEDVYFWKGNYSSSFNFYTSTLHKEFTDSVLNTGKKLWLAFDVKSENEILDAGYKLGQRYSAKDYEITKLDIKFINPEKRDKECSEMVIAEVVR
jgi:hypothetical protein